MFSSKCAKNPTFFSQNSKTMSTKSKKNNKKTTMLDGMMGFSKTDNGLNILDFACTEYVEMESFVANCKVQAMHNGDVYITEKPKRLRNTPLFREDNSSLTLGRDGKYYFVFTMPEELVDELPEQLVLQAVAIAKKMVECLIKGRGMKR